MAADLSKLHPAFRARVEALLAATGGEALSGWRPSEQQAYLFECYQAALRGEPNPCNNGNPANPPGTSNHEADPWGEPMGLAVDFVLPSGWTWAEFHAEAAKHRIHFPIANVEPWHGQPVEVVNAYFVGIPDMGGVPAAPAADVSARRRAPGLLRLSSQGAALIAEFEGFVPTIYRDAVGVETIGYGETRPDIIESYRGREMPQDEAYRLLTERVENDYAPAVRAVGIPLAQSEFDALCSFAYNLGAAIFGGGSTIGEDLRRADYEAVADAFGLYVNAGGRRLEGLVRRRAREAALFRSEWGLGHPLPLAAVSQEDDMPAEFRRRKTDHEKHPTYDASWVPMNAQPLHDGYEWRVNVHVQQEDPAPDRVAAVAFYGPGMPPEPNNVRHVGGGETVEVQPQTYGPVAVVSLDDVELRCEWDRIVERAGG